MPETTEVTQQQKLTLTENDLNEMNEMSFFNQQEIEYMEQLNIDKEVSPKVTKEETEPKQEAKLDLDAIKVYFNKRIDLQVVNRELTAVEHDFYTKAALVANEIPPTSLSSIDEFFEIRLDNILHNSKVYARNIAMQLTEEELELYKKLCYDVEEFKRMIYEKLGITR